MTHQTTILLDLSESDGPETPFDPLKYPVRLLGAQIALAAALGVSAFLSFCFLRRTYPQFYEARRSVKKNLPPLNGSLFGWLRSLYLITDDQVLEHAGLDAFVVRTINFCRDWKQLDDMFDQRKQILVKLEHAWSDYLGPTPAQELFPGGNNTNGPLVLREPRPRPKGRVTWFGPKVDLIDYYSQELSYADDRIAVARTVEYAPTDTAFVTLDSVASAQMAAQAVLDPRPHRLIPVPAPAPDDLIWRNMYMSQRESLIRRYTVTAVIIVLTILFIIPVSYVASLLNPKTIQKLWPAFYRWVAWDGWSGTFITGILPTLVFTLLNFLFPFLYLYLANKQGFVSYGEVELSVISKNFFYVFFNMFMVFTIAGTVSDYWALLKDTTKIARNLAKSLTRFSLFYVDLIILQGVGMFPFKLLQLGGGLSKLQFALPPWHRNGPTARELRGLRKPPVFNYGMTLPQPILILIIVLLYSVLSSKILFFGAIYFLIGYYVYKFQLLYCAVHPQHSTGRAWIIIVRRFMIGMLLFHITMTGILALHQAFFLATVLAPLPIVTLYYWHNFEDDYVPLSSFIALTAIVTRGSGGTNTPYTDEENSVSSMPPTDLTADVRLLAGPDSTDAAVPRHTLDEQRERNQQYINPNMTVPLEGPWVRLDDGNLLTTLDACGETFTKRRLHVNEWE
ncbi:hypothetical protein DV495_001744 [Geotrichum candidum]|nr:hypothetical protein DV495_001744 [Geotrichum candidum]